MASSLIGKQLANYHIQRQLGQGGMATVYYAMDTSLDRPVAVKVIDARFQSDPEYARRFVEEAKIIARWRNNNIVQVYYAGQEEDIYFFVMEYIEGASLAELIDDYTANGELMPHNDVIRIGGALANALDYAHQQNIIHRDVKPQNVMIGFDDRVVLMDFGLALDVQQGTMGTIFGTPHYISPEQARSSADVVPVSDIYSLAVILYEMLTGEVPFDDPSAATLALQHLSVPPPSPRSINPALSERVDDVLLKALAKNAAERYPTGVALIAALDQAVNPVEEIAADINNSMPLPPAMMGGVTSRRMSQMSVSERIALKLENTPASEFVPAPVAVPSITRPAMAARTVKAMPDEQKASVLPNNRGLLLGGVIGILLLIVVFAGLLMTRKGPTDDTPLPTQAQLVVQAQGATATNTILPSNNVEAVGETSTAIAIALARATDTPDIVPSATPLPPTATNTVIPPSATMLPPTVTEVADVASPTPVPPTAIPTSAPAVPTVLYPSGRRIQLLWDDWSFYLSNQSGASIRVSPIGFEALNGDGNALPYSFDAGEWSRFFSQIENNKCDAIELNRAPSWLRPSQCRDYNAFTTLSAGDNRIFWDGRDGATRFRVYFNNQEIAQCELAARVCSVLLPPE